MARVVILFKCTVLVMLAVVVASCTVHSTRSYVCDYAKERFMRTRVDLVQKKYNTKTNKFEVQKRIETEAELDVPLNHADGNLLPVLLNTICTGTYGGGMNSMAHNRGKHHDGTITQSLEILTWSSDSHDTISIYVTTPTDVVLVSLVQPKDAKFLLVFDYGNPFRLSTYADFLNLPKSKVGPLALNLAKEVFRKSGQPVPEVLSSFEAFGIDTARSGGG